MFNSALLANPGKLLGDIEARGALMLSGMNVDVYVRPVAS